MIEYLPPLLLAWSIQITGVLSPGPSVARILGIATSQGRGPALVTVLGIGTASIVLSLATVLGMAAIFAQVAELMTIVRFIGAAYLLWLAYGAFRKAITPPTLEIGTPARSSTGRLWLAGFLLQVTNPKAILFWLAIAAIGGVGEAPTPVVAVFITGAFVISVAGHGLWALVFSAAPIRRAYLAARRPVETLLGTFYAFAAFKLATARS
ncbi:LysE family translocator [Algicella marina]|uniref:LysE family translocator n=1 Tax=Algicella marina TaxID=2683284 RepID=A0A6P1T0I3_9RHOB|nr:LysE family translocator [Algicella marina]QHQ36238.1 LysE family translocator [Algicella marina]